VNEFPAEHGGEEVADVVDLRHLPRPRRRIYQARNSLLQLMRTLSIITNNQLTKSRSMSNEKGKCDEKHELLALEEEGSLSNEVAVGLDHGEDIEHVLFLDHDLGTQECAVVVAVAELEELGKVAVGEAAPGLVLVLEDGQAGHGQAEEVLELGYRLGAALAAEAGAAEERGQ